MNQLDAGPPTGWWAGAGECIIPSVGGFFEHPDDRSIHRRGPMRRKTQGEGMKKLFAFVVIVIAVGLGIAPLGFGHWAHSRMERMYEDMSASGFVRLSVVEVHSGWFSSTSTVRARLTGPIADSYEEYQRKANAGSSEPLTVTLRQRIHHGPVSFTAGGDWRPALAVVDTDVVSFVGEEVAPEDFPADIRTRLGLFGGGTTRVDMPEHSGPIDDTEAELSWAGLSGTIAFSEGFGRVNMNFEAPSLTVEDSDARLTVSNATLTSRQREGLEGLGLGEAEFAVEAVRFDPSNERYKTVHVDSIKIEVQAHEGEDRTVDSSMSAGVDEIRVADLTLGPAVYAISLRNLDAATVADLDRQIRELQQKDIPQKQMGMMLGAKLFAALPDLLKKGPVLELTELSVDSENGKAKGSARLTVDTSDPRLLGNPFMIKEALIADARVRIPQRLLIALTERTIRREMATLEVEYSDEEVRQMARERVRQQMAKPMANNVLVLEDGEYRLDLSLKNGVVELNGKKIEPAALSQ